MLNVELKKRVIGKVRDMYTMNEDYTLTREEAKKWGDFLYNGWKYEFTEDGKRIGRKEGRIAGLKEKAIEMIKSMLKNDIDVKTVAKVSNKTIEEIKEIEKSMK
jgi:predicted transposase/invertase (TIGR01784 family)